MKTVGTAATIGGVLVAGASLLMKTSVHSDGDYRFGSYIPASDTLNLGLLQNQHLVFEGGLALFLAGVILLSAGALIESLAGNRSSDHVSHFSDQQAAPAATAPYGAGRAVDPKQQENTRLFYICSAVLLAIMVAGFFVLSQTSGPNSSVPAVVENNGDALADRMEAEADNIDALADNTTAGGSRKGR